MTETKITETKTIAVVGAAGATGGGLARAILADPEGGFACRAITRTPDSAAARALADQGATVVRADLDNVDSLVAPSRSVRRVLPDVVLRALRRRAGGDPGRQPGPAAAAAGVGHAIWSTAEDTRRRYPLADDRMPTLQGRFKVPQWDAKSEGDVRFDDAGVPTTYLLTPFHWEAWVFGLGAPQPGPDGVLTAMMPLGDALLPGIAAEDIGRCAYGCSAAARSSSERPSGSPENTSPASGSQPGWRACGTSRCATSRRDWRCSVHCRFPASRSRPTCSSTWPRSTTTTAGCGTCGSPGR